MSKPEHGAMQDDVAQDFDPYGDASPMTLVAHQESDEHIHPTKDDSAFVAETTNTIQPTMNEVSGMDSKHSIAHISQNTNTSAMTIESSTNLPGLDIDHTNDIISKNVNEPNMARSRSSTIKAEDTEQTKTVSSMADIHPDLVQSTAQIKQEPLELAPESMPWKKSNGISTIDENETANQVTDQIADELANKVPNQVAGEMADEIANNITDAEMILHDIPIQAEQTENSTAPEVEYDSSVEESSSEDSLSTDSDDSEDSAEDYELLDPIEQARRLMEGDGSDDEGGRTGAGGVLRTVNEKEDEAVEIPDIQMTPDTKIEELGKVEAVVDNMILIKAKTSGEYQVLEAGSALCTTGRVVIGVVAETLGRVQEPLYCVRFSNAQVIAGFGIERDTAIHYIPEHSHFVFTKALQGMKGSDASNIHDEEVGRDEIEFSDDEAEAEYKKQKKLQKQERKGIRGGSVRGRGDAQRGVSRAQEHDLGTSLSYDDVNMEDQLYTPLVRPASMNTPGQQMPRNQSSDGYSRGAGGMRGFGNRGRGGNRGRPNGNHYPNGRQQSTATQGMPSQGYQTQQQQQPFQFAAPNTQLQPPYPAQGFQMSQSYNQYLHGQFPAPQHTFPSQYNQANQWSTFQNAQQQQPATQPGTQQQYTFQGHQNVLPPGAFYNPVFFPSQTGNPPG